MPVIDNDIGPSQIVTSTTRKRGEQPKTAQQPLIALPRRGGCCGGTPEPNPYEPEPPTAKPLTWATMLKLFASSMVSWSKAGYKMVDKEEHKRRYAVCKECEFLVEFRCEKCGCFMYIKSKLAGMKCRADRW